MSLRPLRGQVIRKEPSHRRIEGKEALVEPRGDGIGPRAELRETLLDVGDLCWGHPVLHRGWQTSGPRRQSPSAIVITGGETCGTPPMARG
jgi:hypothetical protein